MAAGSRFGPSDDLFELKKVLGEGAQAKVWSCTRIRTGKPYAVKIIDVEKLEKGMNAGKVRTNLFRELRIMRQLTHPRIVNLLVSFRGGERGDSICYVVMDLATGGSLFDRLRAGVGLGSEQACKRIGYQLLEGMSYMHNEGGVIHRDLKPANVLVWLEQPPHLYDIKIADFGLSRFLKAPGGVTKGQSVVGTPAYVAPEVFTEQYDEKADYFSFGCILFTLLCGEYPFGDPDNRPPHHFNPNIPVKIIDCKPWSKVNESARSIITGLLKHEPTQRLDHNGCVTHPFFADTDFTPIARMTSDSSKQTLSEDKAVKQEKRQAYLPQCYAGLCDCFIGKSKPQRRSGSTLDNGRPELGVVSEIRGWMESAVDSMEIRLQNGNVEKYGSAGGVTSKQAVLGKDELVIAVSQTVKALDEQSGATERGNYLGDAFVFFTSKGRIISFKGSNVPKRSRFVAPSGSQIIGLQFESSRLVGIYLEEDHIRSGRGAIERIIGWEGYAVDSVELHLRSGTSRFYGGDGGNEKREWKLALDERILIVDQGRRDNYLGYSLVFYTSKGNVFQLQGMINSRSLRFIAPAGRQIYDVGFKNGRLDQIRTCPASGSTDNISSHEPIVYRRPSPSNNNLSIE